MNGWMWALVIVVGLGAIVWRLRPLDWEFPIQRLREHRASKDNDAVR